MTAQEILDRGQVAFLGNDPTNAMMSDWCNTCISSGLGPVKTKYGNVAVWGVLKMWMHDVEAKMTPEERG